LLNGQTIHDLFSQPAGGAASNGKGAKDQHQSESAYFPFFLQSAEHCWAVFNREVAKFNKKRGIAAKTVAYLNFDITIDLNMTIEKQPWFTSQIAFFLPLIT
jgi:hypothetical protein